MGRKYVGIWKDLTQVENLPERVQLQFIDQAGKTVCNIVWDNDGSNGIANFPIVTVLADNEAYYLNLSDGFYSQKSLPDGGFAPLSQDDIRTLATLFERLNRADTEGLTQRRDYQDVVLHHIAVASPQRRYLLPGDFPSAIGKDTTLQGIQQAVPEIDAEALKALLKKLIECQQIELKDNRYHLAENGVTGIMSGRFVKSMLVPPHSQSR